MTSEKTEEQLPKSIAEVIRKNVFKPSIRQKSLDEEALLSAAEMLFAYYPPTEEQKAAALSLRKWNSALQLTETSGATLEKLNQTIDRAIDMWHESMRMSMRSSEERRYYEERRGVPSPAMTAPTISSGTRFCYSGNCPE